MTRTEISIALAAASYYYAAGRLNLGEALDAITACAEGVATIAQRTAIEVLIEDYAVEVPA